LGTVRVALDIGGTFTDVVVYDEATDTYLTGKSPTTPDDLASGVEAALPPSVQDLSDVQYFVHGTTVGLNALLQRRGERVMLLATSGAGDVYHIARGDRIDVYNARYRKPTPLVPRRDVIEIDGRLDFRGNELEPLDESAITETAARIRNEGVNSVAIAFLFSYLNPSHENRAKSILQELLPDVSISVSSDVAREWREYERTSSAVLDAYIAPAVSRYLTELSRRLQNRGLDSELLVMQSSGGIISAPAAAKRPLQTLLSGPVGGTAGGVALGEILQRENLICIDMGGTSLDLSLVTRGAADLSPEATIEGFPILMPVGDLHTIGAGGGSIAYTEGGGLRVGPRSAGADPGPACYGRGGTDATVTDANLVLGRIDPRYFLGGNMTLDVAQAEQAVGRLANELNMDPGDLADGIIQVVNAKMAQAIRTVTVERGIEPRDFAIVAFGGAGPMHAAALAVELGVPEVIVPPHPGAFSSWGMLQTPLRQDFSHPFFRQFGEVKEGDIEIVQQDLTAEAVSSFESEGFKKEEMEFRFEGAVRYVGQEHTLSLPMRQARATSPVGLTYLEDDFHDGYKERYGHANPASPLEFVNLRLTALVDLGRPLLTSIDTPSKSVRRKSGSTETTFDGIKYKTGRLERSSLLINETISGPVIIEEETATTIVPPEASVKVNEFGCLVISVNAL
jgi:N-methylhydantoinase A